MLHNCKFKWSIGLSNDYTISVGNLVGRASKYACFYSEMQLLFECDRFISHFGHGSLIFLCCLMCHKIFIYFWYFYECEFIPVILFIFFKVSCITSLRKWLKTCLYTFINNTVTYVTLVWGFCVNNYYTSVMFENHKMILYVCLL